MGMFSKDEKAEIAQIGDFKLECQICKHDRFFRQEAQVDTAKAFFGSINWSNAPAICYVCERCGYIHWFLPVDK